MNATPLYPLRFEPIYQYRLWGGRRLARFLSAPLPGEEPIGEAWLLSDREDHASRVVDGPLRGKTLAELSVQFPEQLLGKLTARFHRFPLLLKLLDVLQPLSVQVHPSGETGKTEAWVVLETGPQARIFAGLTLATTAASLRRAIADGAVVEQLAGFTPNPGDAVLIPAGTVHSLVDVVVFEVQQNSDVTFRLYDWDHIDPRTSQRRPLQVEQAMACIDFAQHAIRPLTPQVQATQPAFRAQILLCEHFGVTRISAELPFVVGKAARPRVLFCLAGSGELAHAGHSYPFGTGEVVLLPAVVGECACVPRGTLRLLEIALPELS
ncbi:MAG TPA: type I phosphomannose isomerase catalytic subunit [Steroidobacteraceae bacterium]|jgi:mannose-6-phosphate isomerase